MNKLQINVNNCCCNNVKKRLAALENGGGNSTINKDIANLQNIIYQLQLQVEKNSSDIRDILNALSGNQGDGDNDNIVISGGGEVYVITANNVGEVRAKLSYENNYTTFTGEDACAVLVYWGANQPSLLQDYLNEKYPNAGIGAKAIIRSHMYDKGHGASMSTDSTNLYGTDRSRINTMRKVIDTYNTVSFFYLHSATKVTASNWAGIDWVGRVNPGVWSDAAPTPTNVYGITIGTVTPYTQGRTHIQFGIWDAGISNYIYQDVEPGDTVQVPENTNYVIEVSTDYIDGGTNYSTYHYNGRATGDATKDINLTQATVYRIRVNDGNKAIDDVDWRATVNNPVGGMHSPQTDIIRDEGDIFVLMAIKEGYKTQFICNTEDLQSNITANVNLVALTNSTFDVTLVRDWSSQYPASLVGNDLTITPGWAVDEYTGGADIILDTLGEVTIETTGDVDYREIYTFRNNARQIRVSINLGANLPVNSLVGTITLNNSNGSTKTLNVYSSRTA